MTMTYWIQNADLSTAIDDDPVESVEQVLHAFDTFDWSEQHTIFKRLENEGQDNCPSGLGVVKPDGIILHLCPNEDGTVFGFWHHLVPTKILGLLKAHKNSIESVERLPLPVAREAIAKFIKGDEEWLARNFKDS